MFVLGTCLSTLSQKKCILSILKYTYQGSAELERKEEYNDMINRVQKILINYSCTLLIDPEVAGSEIVEDARDLLGIFESKSAYVSRYFKELIKGLEAKDELEDITEDLVETLRKDAATSYENQANNMVSQRFRHQRLTSAFVTGTMSSNENLISLSSGLPKHYHEFVSICKSKRFVTLWQSPRCFYLPKQREVS